MDKWDKRFLEMAKLVSTWSKDPSTQVGAVIVRPDKSVASIGFNGFPQSMPDDDELYANREEKYCRIIHAEMNALNFSRDQSHKGYTVYCWPFLPCITKGCFIHLVQSGITRFVSVKATDDIASRWGDDINQVRKYAKECNVEIIEYPLEDMSWTNN